jgi:hypothetical protein
MVVSVLGKLGMQAMTASACAASLSDRGRAWRIVWALLVFSRGAEPVGGMGSR